MPSPSSLLRTSAECWRCSQCGAVFFCQRSVFHLLWLFQTHLRRGHGADPACAGNSA